MIDPLLEVTPTMALAETFTAFIVQPMEHLGRHIGKFFNALLQETSWLSSPVILSFVFIAILLSLVMMFNYRFRLPFFLGSFEPRNNLSDSFAIERKEQKEMIYELKTTIEALKDASTHSKTAFKHNLTDNIALTHNFQETPAKMLSIETVKSSRLIENCPSSSLYFLRNCEVKESTNLTRASSSPSKICSGSKSESLQDDINPFDFTYETTERKVNVSENELDDSRVIIESGSNVRDGIDVNDQKSLYESSPKKKLVVKTNDNDPNDTDFEWITEMLGNKLGEVQDGSKVLQNEYSEKELKVEDNDFLAKAKCVFNEVLES